MRGALPMVLQAHVAPSILAADFAALGDGIKRCGPHPPAHSGLRPPPSAPPSARAPCCGAWRWG